MSDQPAYYHFIPWARSGMAALVTAPVWGKKGPVPAGATSRVELPVTVKLNGKDVPLEGGDKPHLYGPGDVIGIDQREIIRTGPLHLTPDYASEKFACIEFDRPDFPWLFTPAAPDRGTDKDETDCLRPWIVLVVVQKSEATITVDASKPLPVLKCPADELPNLDESWAWAHAQYAGDGGANLPSELNHNPDLNLSRVLCPRKLAPNKAYYACLIPAFEAGRKAGLGLPCNPETERLAPCNVDSSATDGLPVYYHWEFGTGDADQFIELAEKLKPLTDITGLQAGDMDLSRPGNGMREHSGLRASIPSALTIGGKKTNQNNIVDPGFKDDLWKLLTSFSTTAKTADLPPPVYGNWHAPAGDVTQLLADSHSQGWLSTLNLDPSYRVAAALGTHIIQQEQEHWVAIAWEQVGELQRVNEYLQRKQLACYITTSIYEKRLRTLSTRALLQITRPVIASLSQDKTLASTTGPCSQDVDNSSTFRRMTRGCGCHAMEESVSDCSPEEIAPPPGATEGAVQVSGYRKPATHESKHLAARMDVTEGESGRAYILEQLNPDEIFRTDVKDRVILPTDGSCTKHEDYGPVTYAPTFPTPMYEPLRDLFPDMLLPGLDKIPNDRVTPVDPNPAFIEAYLAGLNHELSREFLWREFPTLLNTTYFRQFWDVRGSEQPADPQKIPEIDIPEMKDWHNQLGKNMAAGRGTDLTFLLIRGELLVRYPNALIYALDTEDKVKLPVLRITPVPGVTLLGFGLNPPNKSFIIEEHCTEPYFGPDTGENNAYVSLSQHANSAEVAKATLHDRYRKKFEAAELLP